MNVMHVCMIDSSFAIPHISLSLLPSHPSSFFTQNKTKQAPAFVTLKALADAGGISASLSSIVSHPETFQSAGLDMALDVPTMSFEIWTLICVFQVLSLAKSALASNGNELSQSDITALVSCCSTFVCLCVDSSSTVMSATLVTHYLLYLLYLIDLLHTTNPGHVQLGSSPCHR